MILPCDVVVAFQLVRFGKQHQLALLMYGTASVLLGDRLATQMRRGLQA